MESSKDKGTEKPRWVKERFTLERKGGVGDEVQIVDDSFFEENPTKSKLCPRLNKFWPDSENKGSWKTSSYKIKNYETWIKIRDKLENEILPKIGWTHPSKIMEEIKEKEGDNLEVQNKIQKLMEQNPSFINNFLNNLDVKNLGKEDIYFVAELINNLDKKLLEAEDSIKGSFKSIMKNLSSSNKKGITELNELLNTWDLLDLTSITSILCRRLKTMDLFEDMITKDKTYEIKGDNSIHRILERNLWILDENYWLIQSNKSLRTFIGDEILKKDKSSSKNRPDFVCCNKEKKLLLVEIKKPSITIKKKEIDQIESYTIIAGDYKSKDFTKIEAYLVGNKLSPEGKKYMKLRPHIKYLSYNDLIEKTKYTYQEYLKKLEEIKCSKDVEITK